MIELLFKARYLNITYVLAIQHLLGVTPEIIFDYVFLFSDDFIPSLRCIYNNYAAFFPDFASFCNVYNQVTQDYRTMIIKNNYTDFYDKIAHYKAPNLYVNTTEQKQSIIRNISTDNKSLDKKSIKNDLISDINDDISIFSKDNNYKKSSNKNHFKRLLQRYQTSQELILKLIDKYGITDNDSILHNSLITNLKNQNELLCIYKYCLHHNIQI